MDVHAHRTQQEQSDDGAARVEQSYLVLHGQGTPAKLLGVGTFTPSIDRTSKFKINMRADVALRNDINAPDGYKGAMRNKDRISLDDVGYKELRDAGHPADPLGV